MGKEKLRRTPSQTVGPFFAYSLTAKQYGYDFSNIVDGSLLEKPGLGEHITVVGRVFDGEGKTIHDALIEFWQADEKGKYRIIPFQKNDAQFKGFGRQGTGTESGHHFIFSTKKPGSVNSHPPHINVILFMRGSLRHMYTRLYFSDEENEKDPLLKSVEPNRRQTLIAKAVNKNKYQFDIHMQGPDETVFFDL